MSTPTPRQAAPSHMRRTALVSQVLDSLEGIEDLPPAQEAERLAEAQVMLARVLDGDPTPNQTDLPGTAQ